MNERELGKSLHYKWPVLVFFSVQVQMQAFRVNDVKAAVDSRKIGYSRKNSIDEPMFGVLIWSVWEIGERMAEKLDKSVYLSLNQSAENSAKYAFFQTNKRANKHKCNIETGDACWICVSLVGHRIGQGIPADSDYCEQRQKKGE